MARVTVKDLKSGPVSELYLISEPSIAVTKKGSDYLRCKLNDKTGSIPAVWWDAPSNVKDAVLDGKVVWVSGDVGEYQGAAQVKLNNMSVDHGQTFNPQDFERISAYSIEEMWGKLVDIVSTLESSMVKGVAEDLLLNITYSAAFKRAPAATGMHHAFIGGLLEHTWQMLEVGNTILKLPFMDAALNRDLCLFGILFHDFGKIFEYKQDAGFGKTIQGKLVPHIPMVAAMIYESSNQKKIPEVVRDHMMHVVLAHHKRLQWGSPVTFSCPEAAFVHYVDNMHGDVFGFLQKVENDGAGKEFVMHGFGEDRNDVVVERFSSILKKCESVSSGDDFSF